jgi:hypothetical protein
MQFSSITAKCLRQLHFDYFLLNYDESGFLLIFFCSELVICIFGKLVSIF